MDDGFFVTYLQWPEQDTVGVLQALGYAGEEIGDELSYHEIGNLEQPGPAIAECDGWFMIGDPHVQLLGERTADGLLPAAWASGLASMPSGSCAWIFNCIGKSESFVFTKIENGKIRRHYGIHDGILEQDQGEPLPEENLQSDSGLNSEERLDNLLKRIGLPLADFYKQSFDLYD